MLASKISCLLMISLAFLLGALLVMPSQGQTWARFKNKHIDSTSQYPPYNRNIYCGNQMRRRRMTNPFCKFHNTFIYAPDTTVQKICQHTVGPNDIPSIITFNLVDCIYTGGSPPNNCNYQGSLWTKRIVVTCDNYVPVHFIRYIRQTK